MPKVSSRGMALPPSPIRKLAPYAEAAKARGVKVFHLNIGQPDLETPKVMRDRLKSVDPVIAYSPSQGTPQYLDAMCRYYATVGLKVLPQNLVATTGGSEAVLFAFVCLAEAGDEVIVFEPFYTNYSSFATMAGVKLVPVRCRGEEGFHLPAREAFEKALSKRTRFVLLCNPNNPTGTVYSRDEVQRVADFCRDHDLFFVSDEVYREFVYGGLSATSALDLPGMEDRVVVVDSLSKRFSACGIRLGCFVSRNADVIAAVIRAAQGRLSPPGLAQILALGMSEITADYYAGVRNEYQRRRDVMIPANTFLRLSQDTKRFSLIRYLFKLAKLNVLNTLLPRSLVFALSDAQNVKYDNKRDIIFSDKAVFDPKINTLNAARINKTIQTLLTTKEVLAKRNIKLLVVPVPSKSHMHSEEYMDLPENEQALLILEKALVKNNINFVDVYYPMKEFLKNNPNKLLYYADDGHWNTNTNIIIARQISDKIKAEIIVTHE